MQALRNFLQTKPQLELENPSIEKYTAQLAMPKHSDPLVTYLRDKLGLSANFATTSTSAADGLLGVCLLCRTCLQAAPHDRTTIVTDLKKHLEDTLPVTEDKTRLIHAILAFSLSANEGSKTCTGQILAQLDKRVDAKDSILNIIGHRPNRYTAHTLRFLAQYILEFDGIEIIEKEQLARLIVTPDVKVHHSPK